MRFLSPIGILSGLIVLGAQIVEARDGRGGGGGFMKCFQETMQPTPEQKAKMRDLMKGKREQRQQARKKMDEIRQQWAALEKKAQGSASAAELKSEFERLVKAQSEHRIARFDDFLAIRDLLTPEQRAKLSTCRKGIGFPEAPRRGHGEKRNRGVNDSADEES